MAAQRPSVRPVLNRIPGSAPILPALCIFCSSSLSRSHGPGPVSLQVLLKVWDYLRDPFKSTGHGQYQIPVWEKLRAAVATPCSEGGKTPHRGASPSERLGNIPPHLPSGTLYTVFKNPQRKLQAHPQGSGTPKQWGPMQRGPTQWGLAAIPDALLFL